MFLHIDILVSTHVQLDQAQPATVKTAIRRPCHGPALGGRAIHRLLYVLGNVMVALPLPADPTRKPWFGALGNIPQNRFQIWVSSLITVVPVHASFQEMSMILSGVACSSRCWFFASSPKNQDHNNILRNRRQHHEKHDWLYFAIRQHVSRRGINVSDRAPLVFHQ